MKKKIVIAGGTGFIGQSLVDYFSKDNEVVVLTRGMRNEKNNSFGHKNEIGDTPEIKYVRWDGNSQGTWTSSLENAQMLINLCGKTVNCRYTKKNKKEIFDSRTQPTIALGNAIGKCITPPKLWINASSATIYRNATDHAQDEYIGEIEDDFSVQVCKAWEKTFFDFRTPFTRKVALRMAITLGNGGVMVPYFNLLKFGLGGRQGNGKQMYSWVHIKDAINIINWISEHKDMEGVYNCCSPHPVNNETFMKTLRNVTGNNFGLPAYKWMLTIGAGLIGTETELLLKSRWVLPTKLLESGYKFEFEFLNDAFTEIVHLTPRKTYRLL